MSEIYNFSDQIRMAQDAGLLEAVESFLRGLPQEVRTKLTAGELADAVLKMIDNVRTKKRGEQ